MNEAYPDAISHVNRPAFEGHGGVSTIWRRDGWGEYNRFTWNTDGANPGTFVLSVSGDRGIITGPAPTGNGNGRLGLLHKRALYENSEIESTWWGPSILDGTIATPQIGHIHRAQVQANGAITAYVVSANIAFGAFNSVNMAVWGQNPADPTNLIIGDNQVGKPYNSGRVLQILAVRRFTFGPWFNEYTCHRPGLFGMAAGDVVTIDAVNDNTFDLTNVSVNGVTDNVVQVISPSVTGAVALKIEAGTITPAPHKNFFPLRVKSQLRGTVLRIKAWRPEDGEPSWADTTAVGVYDGATAGTVLTPPVGRGLSGIAVCHLRGGANYAISDINYGVAV